MDAAASTNYAIDGPGAATMSYQLAIHEKPGYLHFQVTGENSVQSVRGYLLEVSAACAQRQCATVLIEENLQGTGLSLVQIFEIVATGTEQPLLHIRRIAYVDVNSQHSPPNMKFAETVAVNRGLALRLFAKVADAEEWLRKAATQTEG